MRRFRNTLVAAVSALVLSSSASAYYHYVHFTNRVAPFTAMPEKYDVAALKNKTVYYFISEQGPSQLAPGDTFGGLISQIRLAAKTWNDVPSSDLRVAFGGLAAASTPQDGPGIDVSFSDDIPPGVWALGGVASVSAPATGASGPFVPITRGMVRMPRALAEMPSYTERGFMIALHEFGHALGLQHTFTSGTMSTEITRATTRGRPLSDDDIAAISVLYPTGSFLSQTGKVTGRVTAGGVGMNLASVVAISATGPAISTLTNPDGTYTIQGIPAGSYYLYTHPLPPALNGEASPGAIVLPKGPDDLPLAGADSFDTQFFPGTRDPNGAMLMNIGAGESKSGYNFTVQRKARPDVSSVTTYGYYGNVAVAPAPLVGNTNGAVLVARGTGLVGVNNSLAPGLNVRSLADSGVAIEPTSVKYYTSGYIRFDVYPGFGWAPGQRHLLFSTRDDLYVLPSSLLLVNNQGPQISSVRAVSDERGARAAQITGSNFDATTRIFFDGVQAAIIRMNPDGSLLVTPPAAVGGHRANVIAVNGDGQSSLFSQPAGGPSYTYDASDAPFVTVSPGVFPAGSEMMVEITGANVSFAEGQTVVGFGSSAIAVRKTWVVGPNRLLANVSVDATAQNATSNLTVVTGLQTAVNSLAVQIAALAPGAKPVSLLPPVVNAATGSTSIAPGGTGVLGVVNLNTPASGLTLTIGGQRATILAASTAQITFLVPPGVPAGPAVVRLQSQGGENIQPILIDIEAGSGLSVAAVYSSAGVQADGGHPAIRGNQTGLFLTGLPEAALLGDPGAIRVNVGGVDHPAMFALPSAGGALVQFVLSTAVTGGPQIPLTVAYGGLTTAPVSIPVR